MNARDLPAVSRSALRTYRVAGISRRLIYEVDRRSGLVRKREERINGRALPTGVRLPSLDLTRVRESLNAHESEVSQATGKELTDGRLNLFGGRITIVGWPPRWLADPDSGRPWPTGHWSTISDYGDDAIDVRDTWELNRFSWVGTLLRAQAAESAGQWDQALWMAVNDWCATNPAFLGVNWMSGQEAALRGLSLLLAAGTLTEGGSASDVPAPLTELLDATTARVRVTLRYALSQRNNHALSELVYLWVTEAMSGQSMQTTTRQLRRVLDDQFETDGAYCQHSFMYHRMALQLLLVLRWYAQALGIDVGVDLDARIDSSSTFLASMMDAHTGWLPNTGANDGTRLLQLSATEQRDFRPVLVHAEATLGRPTAIAAGPWDEEARWFGLEPIRSTAPTPVKTSINPSGFHVLRGRRSHVLLHAGSSRHRLGHADLLHVDLWIDGMNVLRDPGTYRYTAPTPWANALADDVVHNVPFRQTPQARRLGRFLWLDWPQAQLLLGHTDGDGDVLVAELRWPDGVHGRRLVARLDDRYLVVDQVPDAHIRWNLPLGTRARTEGETTTLAHPQFAGTLQHHAAGVTIFEATEADPYSGWESSTYGERQSLVAITATVSGDGTASASFAPSGIDLIEPDAASAALLASPSVQAAALLLARNR